MSLKRRIPKVRTLRGNPLEVRVIRDECSLIAWSDTVVPVGGELFRDILFRPIVQLTPRSLPFRIRGPC